MTKELKINPQTDTIFYWLMYAIYAIDPNLITSPVGYDTARWVSVNDNMAFTVYFENDPKLATAPAHNVYIYYPFNAKQDPRTFRLGSFGFNGMFFNVPPNLNYYQTRLDLRDSLGLYVDVTAGINVNTSQAFWIFQSIDPATNQPPLNPLSGFLPVKDSTLKTGADIGSTKGEGFVSFTTKPSADTRTGENIFATAKIVFDLNDTIPTNIAFNTVDAVAPQSHLNPATFSQDTIHLSWTGADDMNGSGVGSYALYVSENNGPFTLYKDQITGLTENFLRIPGNSYCFYTRARDNTGNLEPIKNSCELQIGGATFPLTWLYFNGKRVDGYNNLSWSTASEQNTAKFFIERSTDGLSFHTIGSKNATGNSTAPTEYSYKDYDAPRLPFPMFYYRLRQTDLDGKFTYSRVISIANKTDNAPVVKVYPNPNSGLFTVNISSSQPASAEDRIEIYDSKGVLMHSQRMPGRQPNAVYIISRLQSLASGMYYLTVILKNERVNVGVVKY